MALPVARWSSTRAAVEHAPGRIERRDVDVGRKGRQGAHGGDHGVDVAQSSVGFLQVRLEQEGDFPVGVMALGHLPGEHGQPAGPHWLARP